MSLVQRGQVAGRIDRKLAIQEAQQIEYCEKSLDFFSTIKFRNGNFLGILELLVEYKPTLATNLKQHANKRSSRISYLSSTI